jgi:hypothetical protein
MNDALHRGSVIDIPIESLPYVDEHSTTIAAPASDVWESLVDTVAGTRHGGSALARALGCEHTGCEGDRGEIGSTVPGFIVTRAVRPSVLALMGAHRYSCYALVFRLTENLDGTVRLSAETRAEFPGRGGSVYRLAVIGTRGHVLATTSLLRGVRRRAERDRTPDHPRSGG